MKIFFFLKQICFFQKSMNGKIKEVVDSLCVDSQIT
jgi:hypothetical protein